PIASPRSSSGGGSGKYILTPTPARFGRLPSGSDPVVSHHGATIGPQGEASPTARAVRAGRAAPCPLRQGELQGSGMRRIVISVLQPAGGDREVHFTR